MLNHNLQQYNHSEFVKCRDIADFAKIYNFKDHKGEILGRNKIFRILRQLKILDKNNVPYQGYLKYFKTLDKEYDNGSQTFKKILVFVTPEGQTYLANRINDYLEKLSVSESKQDNNENIKVCCGSPLDFDREQALIWLAELPEILKNSYFAVEVRKKWGIEG